MFVTHNIIIIYTYNYIIRFYYTLYYNISINYITSFYIIIFQYYKIKYIMEQKLTKKDYLDILAFYKIKVKKDTPFNKIKSKAENLLVTKLCKCIKKVDMKNNKSNESRAIAICKNSIMTKKNLGFYKFKCKKTARFIKKKNNKSRKKIYKLLK